jgi:perosamine synthetase
VSQAPLPYGRQLIDDDDVEAVVACLRDELLTQGPRVQAFEEALCRATGSPHAAAVSSGTAALHLATLALGVGPGDVGVTSPITFVASANALRYAGAQVAFADVDAHTGLVTPQTLERALGELEGQGARASLVVPVDLAGQPVDLPALASLAKARGAKVLHDAAHSLGATFELEGETHRVGEGAFADATTLSFHPVKHITTGEGGAVLSARAETHARVVDLRTHGIHKRAAEMTRGEDDPFVGPWYYEQASLGFNYRLPDLACALGLSQLKKLGAFVARRRALAARYNKRLGQEPLASHLAPLRQEPGRQSSYHLYGVRLRPRPGEGNVEMAARRKALYGFLRERGVSSQVHYIPVHWQPDYQGRAWLPEGGLPGAEAYYAGCLSLPLFPAMQDSDVERVVDALSAFVERGA